MAIMPDLPRRVLLLMAAAIPLAAASLPAGFSETLIASGISSPTAFAFAPDGRLFVCQQNGQLRIIKNGSLLTTPFVSLSVDSAGERGLLGIAFDPDFAANQWVYVYYTTTTTPRYNRVSRFTASGDIAMSGSEVLILQLDNLTSATNHNGGAIHFGPDGKLYVAAGDNATGSNAQTLTNMLGKMLRINSDGTMPADNPFYAVTAGNNRSIWAYGLRNPFTFAFQPGTGRMFINDVGQSAWEEINDGIAGSNYGWPATEGVTSNPAYRSPLLAYGHGTGPETGCAITGGAFYNPPASRYPPQFTSKYFYAEYCSGWIRTFDASTGQSAAFATGISNPVDLTIGPDGNLYYLARGGGGAVYRVSFSASSRCDVNFDGATNVVDVQRVVNVILGAPAAGSEDLNRDGSVTVVDLQMLVNTVLGAPCPA
jgi:glucose/arabinose dehydrogenase